MLRSSIVLSEFVAYLLRVGTIEYLLLPFLFFYNFLVIAIHIIYPYFFRLTNFSKTIEIIVNTISNKTYSATPATTDKKWVLVDAEDKPLGRLSSHVATILRGKNKPEFTPHMDTGDNVVVINAEKVALTGKKMTDKLYFRHTGYPGGEKFTTAEEMLAKDPTSLVTKAVRGMLPKNRLGRQLLTNLRVYAGPVHPHTAQQPEITEI